MTPQRMARIVLWLAVIVPWLALVPVGSPLLAVGLSVLMLVAAFHGVGLLVAHVAGRTDLPAALIVHWGLAAMLGVAGALMMVHAYGNAAQTILVFTGAGLNSGLLLFDRRRRYDRLAAILASPETRFWMIPAILLAAVAALHVLGAAGDQGARPFDDDGNHLAQVQRLFDTGTLADPIGFARSSQLGGQVVAGAFANVLGAPQLFRVIDGGLGFALLLWLALTRLRPRDATTGVWALLLILVAAAYPFVAIDPSSHWLATSLILALYVSFRELARDEGALWPIGLVAGALATLRMELAPVAIAIVLGAAVVVRRRPSVDAGRPGVDVRRLAALVAISLAVVVPYVIVWISAKGTVAPSAYAVVAPSRPFVLPLLFVVASVAVGGLLARLIRDPGSRWIAIATLVACMGIITQLSGPRPYATTFLWPILVGGGLALGVDELRGSVESANRPRTLALVLSLLACALIYQGRDISGRVRWVRRYIDLVANIEYLRHAPTERARDHYGPLLAQVPAGATIAVWITRPETLDYARHRIIDLRAPRVALLRRQPGYHLESLLAGVHADYLLVENDLRRVEPGSDDLEALILRHRVAASGQRTRLVDLAP